MREKHSQRDGIRVIPSTHACSDLTAMHFVVDGATELAETESTPEPLRQNRLALVGGVRAYCVYVVCILYS